MDTTPYQTQCADCSASFVTERPFFLELQEAEHYDALQRIADPAHQFVQCPECGQENHLDHHFSVYEPRFNRLYHYLPRDIFSGFDLATMFDSEGDPTFELVWILLADLKQRGALSSELLEGGIHRNTFSLRVYSSPAELVHQIMRTLHVTFAHEAKAERYQKLAPPAEFLNRGSRLYKRSKLKFIYCLGQGFEEGLTYSESDVGRVVRRERKFLKGCEIDDSHARVALIELQLLERTRDGRYYWRKPAPEKIDGLCFPSRLEGFEKSGYRFYGSPEMGFSVTYLSQRPESHVTFYAYGSDGAFSPESIEGEFLQAKNEVLQNYQNTDRPANIVSEKRLTLDKENGRAETVCHLTLSVHETDGTLSHSHLVLTSWRGRFIKVRLTAPDSVQNDEDVLLRLTSSLLKRISLREAIKRAAPFTV